FNPASNMKIFTAVAALLEMGPAFRMVTSLYGRIEASKIDQLWIRGSGDPTLEIGDFLELASEVADRGVREVSHVIVDDTHFDRQCLPPAFDQQPGEASAFRAPVGALAVEGSSYILRVVPGPAAGSPADVRVTGAPYFELQNHLTTTAAGPPKVMAEQ